ncbi:MAG TPA: carboxypeptidase-like regulatory domain-containing protein, partial [Blastocatellia bacterium]|nr:carboxypeptidase-like regulatory domain-containing protein [Blastocatellia bacterium]
MDRPVPRAVVLLTSSESGFSPNRTLPARATTDEEGRYRFTGVPAGTYNLGPSTPAFVLPTETSFGQPGKSVTLAEGEQVDGMDFSLTRG